MHLNSIMADLYAEYMNFLVNSGPNDIPKIGHFEGSQDGCYESGFTTKC